jgi:hypothetical protein
MESWRDAFGGRLLIFLAQRAFREGQQPFESVWRLLQKNRTLKEKRHQRRRIPKGHSAKFLWKSAQKVHKGKDWNLLNERRKARESLLEGHNKTVSCVQIWSTFEWSLHYDFSFVSECRCKRSTGMAMEVTRSPRI